MFSTNLTGPTYYRRGTIQVWDFIRDQELNFHLGNAIKYICRAGHKESKVADLKKAIHYLQNELEHAQFTETTVNDINAIPKPNPIFEPQALRNSSLAWSTGTDLQDSDGFSLGEAG